MFYFSVALYRCCSISCFEISISAYTRKQSRELHRMVEALYGK